MLRPDFTCPPEWERNIRIFNKCALAVLATVVLLLVMIYSLATPTEMVPTKAQVQELEAKLKAQSQEDYEKQEPVVRKLTPLNTQFRKLCDAQTQDRTDWQKLAQSYKVILNSQPLWPDNRITQAEFNQADCVRRSGDYREAIRLFDTYLDSAQGEQKALRLLHEAMCFESLEEYNKAIPCAMKAEGIFAASGNSENRSLACHHLSNCFSHIGDFSSALEWGNKASEFSKAQKKQ